MRYRYEPVAEQCYLEEVGEYTAYGIRVLRETLFGVKEIDRISDISVHCDEVQKLADLCTRHQLSPMHLLDVIEEII